MTARASGRLLNAGKDAVATAMATVVGLPPALSSLLSPIITGDNARGVLRPPPRLCGMTWANDGTMGRTKGVNPEPSAPAAAAPAEALEAAASDVVLAVTNDEARTSVRSPPPVPGGGAVKTEEPPASIEAGDRGLLLPPTLKVVVWREEATGPVACAPASECC